MLYREAVSDADADDWELVLAHAWDLFVKLGLILFLHNLESAAAGNNRDQLIDAYLSDIDRLFALCLYEVCLSDLDRVCRSLFR